jgi:hypothetical protein
MSLKINPNVSYIIHAPHYDSNSGGHSAMHFLAHQLHCLGVKDVFLTSSITNKRWFSTPLESIATHQIMPNLSCGYLKLLVSLKKYVYFSTLVRKINRQIQKILPLIVWQYLDISKTIVVYSENEIGNPLGAIHIVRWIMREPLIGDGGDYGASEHIFLYHDFYAVGSQYKKQIKGVLTAIDLDWHLKTYTNQKKLTRTGGAYLIKKGGYKNLTLHPNDYQCVDSLFENLTDCEKNEFFNQIQVFISYDHMTFLSVQAALSGCLSIIIPDVEGQYSKENLMNVNRIPGIAIGFDDIEFANSSRKYLIPYLETLNKEQLNTILNFKKFVQTLLDCNRFKS